MAVPLLNTEGLDWVVAGMEAAQIKVASSKGKRVKLQQAELDFLKKLEACRTFLEAVTKKKNLLETIGGDGSRIARARAVIEESSLSEQNAGDARIADCQRALDSVEAVLKDLGLESQIADAKRVEKASLLQRKNTILEDYTKAATEMRADASLKRQASLKEAKSEEKPARNPLAPERAEPVTKAGLEELLSDFKAEECEEEDPVKVRAQQAAARKRQSLSDWFAEESPAPSREPGANYQTMVRTLLVLEEEEDEDEDED